MYLRFKPANLSIQTSCYYIVESIALKFFWKTPFEKAFRRPTNAILRSNSLVHDYWVFISHLLPAYLMDAFIKMSGRRP